MKKYNAYWLTVMILCLLLSPATVNGNQPDPALPTVVEADRVYFSDQSGELEAEGNVRISQDQDRIETEHLRGNQQQTTIWVDGNVTVYQGNVRLDGQGLIYNYSTKTGTLDQMNGVLTTETEVDDGFSPVRLEQKQEFLVGQQIEVAPGYLVARNATYTGCDLPKPDYRITADKVEVWPGEQLIAHNAKFWFKDTVLYSIKRYKKTLTGRTTGSTFPSLGYSSDNGIYISQRLTLPLTQRLDVFTDLAYYTKADFKTQYGIRWDMQQYYLQVVGGDYYGSNDVWMKKQPEFQLGIPKRRIGSLPLQYEINASYGKWVEDSVDSWHQRYALYFTADPIALDTAKTLQLSLGTGWRHTRDSYSHADSTATVWQYDVVLHKQWSPQLKTFVGRHYLGDDDSLFRYDRPDVDDELLAGVAYKINTRNIISYKQSYDLDTDKAFSHTYGWQHDLHCWQFSINYTDYTGDRSNKLRIKAGINF